MSAAVTRDNEDTLRVSGEMVFDTVPDLLEEGRRHIPGEKPLVIDLGEVTRADSAGLALMLEWLSDCRREKRELEYRHTPQSLVEIARLSNLDELLPLK